MNPTPSINTPSPGWPEPLRDSPRPADRFPIQLFLLWLLPGLIGLIVLSSGYFLLERRAAKQILYRTPDGHVGAVRADGAQPQVLAIPGEGERLVGSPQWAQHERRFASVISGTTEFSLRIADPTDSSPMSVSLADLAFPTLSSAAWSPSGAYVAVIDLAATGSFAPQLHLIRVRGLPESTPPYTLTGLLSSQWHPQRDAILFATPNAEGQSELRVLTPDGNSQPFAPSDNQIARQYGTWSPDGQRIAYTGTTAITSTTRPLLVANADGSAPQVIVADGTNLQPIWAPRGDFIVFTQLVRITDERCPSGCARPLLYRVQPDGQNLQEIGQGLPPELLLGINPRATVDWSPDHESMYFQSYDEQAEQISLQIARYDGSEPSTIVTETRSSLSASGALSVSWSPTSRAVLIASQSGGLRLRWFDRDTPVVFSNGVSATWEP